MQKIMIVDDEEIVGVRLKASLEKMGHEVQIFTDSEQAKHVLAEERFDLVIADLKMPKFDGMALFRYVKQRWPSTRVIIISGFATGETAKEALKEGVYDFIVKPFRIGRLKQIIQEAANLQLSATRM